MRKTYGWDFIVYRPRHRYPKYKFNRHGEWTHPVRERAVIIAWLSITTCIGIILGFSLAIYSYDLKYPWDVFTPPPMPPTRAPLPTETITPIPPAPTGWYRLPAK